MKNADISLLHKIASLPPDSQKALVKEVEVVLGESEDKDLAEELKRWRKEEKKLTKEVSEHEEKINKLSEIENKYKEQDKKKKLLKSGTKKKSE